MTTVLVVFTLVLLYCHSCMARPADVIGIDSPSLYTVAMGAEGTGNFEWACSQSTFRQGLTIQGRGIVNTFMQLTSLDLRGPLRIEIGGASGVSIYLRNSKGSSQASTVTVTAEPISLPATIDQRLSLVYVSILIENCVSLYNISLLAGYAPGLKFEITNTSQYFDTYNGSIIASGYFTTFSRLAVSNVSGGIIHVDNSSTLAAGSTIDIYRYEGTGIWLNAGTATGASDLCTKARSCSFSIRNSRAQNDCISLGGGSAIGAFTYVLVEGGHSYGSEGPGVWLLGTWRGNAHLSFLHHMIEAGYGKGVAMVVNANFNNFNGTVEFWNASVPLGPITFSFPATANPSFYYINTYAYHTFKATYVTGTGATSCPYGGVSTSMPTLPCLASTIVTRCTESFSVYNKRWPANTSVTDRQALACNAGGGRGRPPTSSHVRSPTRTLTFTAVVATTASAHRSPSQTLTITAAATVTASTTRSHHASSSSSFTISSSRSVPTLPSVSTTLSISRSVDKTRSQKQKGTATISVTRNKSRSGATPTISQTPHMSSSVPISTSQAIVKTRTIAPTVTIMSERSSTFDLTKSVSASEATKSFVRSYTNSVHFMTETEHSSPTVTAAASDTIRTSETDSMNLSPTPSLTTKITHTLSKSRTSNDSLTSTLTDTGSVSTSLFETKSNSSNKRLTSSVTFPIPPKPVEVLVQAVPEAVTASMSSVAAAVGGASAAVDAQAMAVIGLVACSSTGGGKKKGGYRALSPIAITDSCTGVLAGNSIALGGAGLFSIGAVVLLKLAKVSPSYKAAMALARTPSIFFSGCLLLLNSYAVCGTELIRSSDGLGDTILGVFSWLVAVGIVAAFPTISYLFGTRRLVSVSYELGGPKIRVAASVLLPVYQFDNQHHSPGAFGSILGSNRLLGPLWTWVSLLSFFAAVPIIVAEGSACVAMFGVSAVLYFAFSGIVLCALPRRTLAVSVLHAVVLFLNGGLMAVSAAQLNFQKSAEEDTGPAMGTSINGLGYALTFCTGLSMALTVAAMAVQLLSRMGKLSGVYSYECGLTEYQRFFWSTRKRLTSAASHSNRTSFSISSSSMSSNMYEDLLLPISGSEIELQGGLFSAEGNTDSIADKQRNSLFSEVFGYEGRFWKFDGEKGSQSSVPSGAPAATLLALLDIAGGTAMIPTIIAPSAAQHDNMNDEAETFSSERGHVSARGVPLQPDFDPSTDSYTSSADSLDEETQIFIDGLVAADEEDDLAFNGSFSNNSSLYTIAERDGLIPRSIYAHTPQFKAQIDEERHDRLIRSELSRGSFQS